MLLSMRVSFAQCETPEKLQRLLTILGQHRELCDEISYFTESDGLDWRYLTPSEVQRRAAILGEALSLTREAGFGAVINVLNTMGHSDDGGPEAPAFEWQGIVGPDGKTARHCSCPFDPQFLDYVRFKYAEFARCCADRIWIDDDVRLQNHSPVSWGCFCDRCVRKFSGLESREFTRENLIAALAEDHALRRRWAERARIGMEAVIAACMDGIVEGPNGTEAGFMLCDPADFLNWRADLGRCVELLNRPSVPRTWLRPGGGFWEDSSPRSLLPKLHRVANAASAAPAASISYEVENYPYCQGAKSAYVTGLECLVTTLGARLDGIMLNVLDHPGNDPSAFEGWFRDLKTWAPLWRKAAQIAEGTVPLGWRPIYSPDHFVNQPELNLGSVAYLEPLELQLAGLPVTAFEGGTLGHFLTASTAAGMSGYELRKLLEKPLIMDGGAAEFFLHAGLGGSIGIQSAKPYSEGVYEVFTNHSLNGEDAGFKRCVTLRYFGATSYALDPMEGAEILSELWDYHQRPLGAALTLWTGGDAPVAILGHHPWRHSLYPQRMRQLQALSQKMLGVNWGIKNDRTPVVAWWRGSEGSPNRVALFNAGFDEARDVEIGAGGETVLSTAGCQLETGRISLPAWGVAVVKWS